MATEALTPDITLEARLELLEKQMRQILGSPPQSTDWQRTVGTWTDDAESREIDRLGQEWRRTASD